MPKYSPSDDEMDSLYSTESPSKPAPKEEGSVDEENAESPTAIVPKSVLGEGTKVGDVCEMRVVADHGDEMEMEYVSEPKEESTETQSPDEELDSMDSKEY